MDYQRFSLLFGFTVWLVATLAFRFWGHHILRLDRELYVPGLYLLTVPVLWFLVTRVFLKFGLNSDQRAKSALLLALPGIIGDVVCIKYYEIIFPTISHDQSIVLSSWVLWSYGAVLAFGILNFNNAGINTKER